MNYAQSIDVFDIYARMITGEGVAMIAAGKDAAATRIRRKRSRSTMEATS